MPKLNLQPISLQNIFPTEESCPDYICIDKACQVMQTAVNSGSWNTWKKNSHFIVDSYHYNNHCASNKLCRKYCNPAPTDGSAPNLVGQKIDRNGVVYDVREFNTQTCEQLNAWLGGFESILQWMTSKNSNWFLHVMLLYHVKHVLAKISVSPVANNQDDAHSNISEESDSDTDREDEESGSSSEEESTNSSDIGSNSTGKNDKDLSSDENSDDNDTEDTMTNSDSEVSNGDTNNEIVEEDEEKDDDELVEEDEEEDDDELVEEDEEEDDNEMDVDTY